jgi:hypothetical protein
VVCLQAGVKPEGIFLQCVHISVRKFGIEACTVNLNVIMKETGYTN